MTPAPDTVADVGTQWRGYGATSGPLAARRRARGAAFGLIVGLIVQLVAGMLVNLFVSIPDSHPGANATDLLLGPGQVLVWAIFQSGLPALIFHAAFGVLLVLWSLQLIFQVRPVGRRSMTWAAVLGFLLILFAGSSGLQFLVTNQDSASFTMALAMALAMFCYVFILFGLGEER